MQKDEDLGAMVHGKKYWISEFFEREREATVASSSQMEATDNDSVLPHQRSRALNLQVKESSCYFIRSTVTKGYVSVGKDGYLFLTLDLNQAQIFSVSYIAGYYYYITVKKENGSSSYIAPWFSSPGTRLKLTSGSPKMRRKSAMAWQSGFLSRTNGSYIILQNAGNPYQWIDKGIDNRLAVVKPNECYKCKSYDFEFLDCPIEIKKKNKKVH